MMNPARQENKVALLFGGSGFIGCALAEALLKTGWQVVVTGRKPEPTRQKAPLGLPGQVTHLAFNSKRDNPLDFIQAVRPTLVVNLIGVLHARPGGFRKVHTALAGKIAEACSAEGVARLIQLSAIGADKNAASRYARSKGLGEEAVAQGFAGAFIVRPSVVFGSGDGFVLRFASLLALAPAMPLIGGGETKFQPVFLGDLVQAMVQLASMSETEAKELRGKALEFGGSQKISLKELYHQILHLTGHKCLLFPMPFFAAGLMAMPMGLLPAPPLTVDQVTLLKNDNLVASERDGFATLGLAPDPLSFHLPSLVTPWKKPYAHLKAPT